MINVLKHLGMLGLKVEDRVTGFKGVVSSVGFDLYGCINAVINPGVDGEGKPRDSHWFDINRLRVVSDTPVMERPAFDWTPEAVSSGEKGPAEKPTYCRLLTTSRPLASIE